MATLYYEMVVIFSVVESVFVDQLALLLILVFKVFTVPLNWFNLKMELEVHGALLY